MATYLSPNQPNISDKIANIQLIQNNNFLTKVSEVEDESMRSIGTKLIDIANLETVPNQSCNEKSAQENSTAAGFNFMQTAIVK